MSTLSYIKIAPLKLALGIGIIIFATKAVAGTYPTARACSGDESWVIDPAIGDEFKSEFQSYLSGQKDQARALRGFSEGIALRKGARTQTEKSFAEYWISRALWSMGLPHVAATGFLSIATRTPDAESVGVYSAALDCLNRIHFQHPSMSVPPQALASLKVALDPSLPPQVRKKTQETAWESSVVGIQGLMAENRLSSQQTAKIQEYLANLGASGPYEAFAQGMWNTRQNQHFKAIASFKKFFSGKIPEALSKYEDTAHLLLARSHYSVGEFDRAANEMKLVSKASNALADSLSELAWADLMNEHYPEAIGTAMNLDAGGLRHTFAPEAPMVSAMAMNELCQYPDAVREITIFRRNYDKAHQWLTNWLATESDHPEKLYPLAVQFIKRKAVLPERVAGEWVRSPMFIASQDEINTLFDERDFLPKVGPVASRSMRAQALEILQHARELKPQLKVAKMKLKAGEQLPSKIRDSLDLLRKQVVHWRRLQLAAPVWVAVSKRFHGTIEPQQQHLIARINNEIKVQNLRMATQLDEIAENIQLIEVEIYNGASQDIIWQNAHPDYKKIAESIREDQDNRARSQVWDWGRTLASSDEAGEIWEDELGSFKANLFDNCSSKDKYLAIRLQRRSGS